MPLMKQWSLKIIPPLNILDKTTRMLLLIIENEQKKSLIKPWKMIK